MRKKIHPNFLVYSFSYLFSNLCKQYNMSAILLVENNQNIFLIFFLESATIYGTQKHYIHKYTQWVKINKHRHQIEYYIPATDSFSIEYISMTAYQSIDPPISYTNIKRARINISMWYLNTVQINNSLNYKFWII